MRFIIFFISLFFVFSFTLFSQENKQGQKNPYDINYKVTYQDAKYPKGEEALYRYFFENIKYSEEAKQKRLNSNALVSFDVLPDSSITNIVILQSAGYGTDEEIKRVLKPLKFAPAIINGEIKTQNVILSIPLIAR